MSICRLLCSCVLVCSAAVASAQTSGATAYVYVSATPANSSVNEVLAYSAGPDGRLTPVGGSPFNANISWMAANGQYLFGSNLDGVHVDSYTIEPSGALTLTNQTDVASYNPGDCGMTGPIFLDQTGQSLYDLEYRAGGCANNQYASLSVTKADGGLKNLGAGVVDNWLSQPASFIFTNAFAYSASCLGDMYWELKGMHRSSTTGYLTQLPNFSAPLPTPPDGDFWCPSQTAADPTGHVAVTLQPVNGSTFTEDGPARVVSFLAHGNGNLTTTNTVANMPSLLVGTPLSMSISPSGKLLAVGGAKGMQVLFYNGSAPAVPYTSLLTPNQIDQIFWDNSDHVYAISRAAGKLYVFNMTPTSYVHAPGSPYILGVTPDNLAVQPLPIPSAQ